jgi:hypothetical protein
MLCPKVSGRVSGVPDVPTLGGQLAANPPLTAYLTAYGFEKPAPELLWTRARLNSARVLLTDSNRVAANQ